MVAAHPQRAIPQERNRAQQRRDKSPAGLHASKILSSGMTGLVVSPGRAAAARELAAVFTPGRHIVLTTHVNADGDGVGSEVGLWHLLQARGMTVTIANPTAIPDRFHFLLPDGADKSDRAVKEIERADLIVVLDIGDLGRVGDLGHRIAARAVTVACIDHHVSPGSLPPGPRLIDPQATATAELVHDLAVALQWPVTAACARALYVGILTDTGGFRFSNTTPRALRVAGALLEVGVDPESIYEQVYANAPEGRIRLLAEVLETLVVEPEGMAWVTVPPGALERHGAEADDLDGIVEFARSVAGTRLALLFRQLANGRVKVSLRSRGAVDVAALAQRFGGGGHVKAAGASLEGAMGDVQATVLAAARAYLGNGAAGGPP
jgi:phosphoesterase RecJ-like protein